MPVYRSPTGKFPTTFSQIDFLAGMSPTITAPTSAGPFVTQSVSNTGYTLIGQVKVLAGQEITFGSNDATPLASSGSSCYMDFYNTSYAVIPGSVRFILSDPQGQHIVPVAQFRTEKLSADKNSRTLAVLLPEFIKRAQQDSFLQVLFKPDATDTLQFTSTDTKWLIPVTIYQ